jgi:hypothetical protein
LWKLSVLAPFALLPLSLAALNSGTFPDRNTMLTFAWVAVLLLIWLLLPGWLALRHYSRLQQLRERTVYRLSDFGVRADGESFKAEIAWQLVYVVRETRTMFIIYHSAQLAWLVPKRFLPSAVDMFRAHLQYRLSASEKYRAPGLLGSFF